MPEGLGTVSTALPALRVGSVGARVYMWQSFLRGRGLDPGPVDGQFGDLTRDATIAYQTRYGLSPDGVVGLRTLLKATSQGFELAEQPRDDDRGSNFPPPPAFAPLITNRERAQVFGSFDFVHAPTAADRDTVRILGNWQRDNIVKVSVPQIRGVQGARGRDYIWFHRLGARQLQALWRAWEVAGLLERVLTYEGSFNPRFVRGSTTNLSNHAFGSGFDINYTWNKLGHVPALVGQRGSVRELVPIANQHGFYWGGHWQGRKDGMHFELAYLQPG
jgi:peptidoglycan hydrolase-like protein with peptidoglycan-binding domain